MIKEAIAKLIKREDLSDDEIRLMIAVFADGSFYSKECSDATYKQARFHLKKDRKNGELL